METSSSGLFLIRSLHWSVICPRFRSDTLPLTRILALFPLSHFPSLHSLLNCTQFSSSSYLFPCHMEPLKAKVFCHSQNWFGQLQLRSESSVWNEFTVKYNKRDLWKSGRRDTKNMENPSEFWQTTFRQIVDGIIDVANSLLVVVCSFEESTYSFSTASSIMEELAMTRVKAAAVAAS